MHCPWVHSSILKWSWDLSLSKNDKKWPRRKNDCSYRQLGECHKCPLGLPPWRNSASGLCTCWKQGLLYTPLVVKRRGSFLRTLLIKKNPHNSKARAEVTNRIKEVSDSMEVYPEQLSSHISSNVFDFWFGSYCLF